MNGTFQKAFAEFFACIGFGRIGLERAGWRIAFANDIEEDKRQVYRDHFGDTGEFVLGAVHELKAAQVPDEALATAAFACSDLSFAGARAGLPGEQSSAFWDFAELFAQIGCRLMPASHSRASKPRTQE